MSCYGGFGGLWYIFSVLVIFLFCSLLLLLFGRFGGNYSVDWLIYWFWDRLNALETLIDDRSFSLISGLPNWCWILTSFFCSNFSSSQIFTALRASRCIFIASLTWYCGLLMDARRLKSIICASDVRTVFKLCFCNCFCFISAMSFGVVSKRSRFWLMFIVSVELASFKELLLGSRTAWLIDLCSNELLLKFREVPCGLLPLDFLLPVKS